MTWRQDWSRLQGSLPIHHGLAPLGYSCSVPSARLALRLLLSLVLVLNGIGTSVAATRMALEHAAHSNAPSQHNAHRSQPAAASGCHHSEQPTTSSKSGLTFSDTSPAKSPVPDCCKSKCEGACLQGSVAAIMTAPIPVFLVERVPNVLINSQAHLAPVLPDLNRPPIG